MSKIQSYDSFLVIEQKYIIKYNKRSPDKKEILFSFENNN
jgi:hypothetical protein